MTSRLIFGLIAMLLLGGAAQAQVRARLPSHAELFARMDTNHDGRVSLQEWLDDEWRSVLQREDANGDGRISREEESAIFCRSRNPNCLFGFDMYWRGVDRNHDGYIDRQEFNVMAERLFRENDRNHDGYVTLDELIATSGSHH